MIGVLSFGRAHRSPGLLDASFIGATFLFCRERYQSHNRTATSTTTTTNMTTLNAISPFLTALLVLASVTEASSVLCTH